MQLQVATTRVLNTEAQKNSFEATQILVYKSLVPKQDADNDSDETSKQKRPRAAFKARPENPIAERRANLLKHYTSNKEYSDDRKEKTRKFQTQLLHYFSKSDNKSNHHLHSLKSLSQSDFQDTVHPTE